MTQWHDSVIVEPQFPTIVELQCRTLVEPMDGCPMHGQRVLLNLKEM